MLACSGECVKKTAAMTPEAAADQRERKGLQWHDW